MFKRNLIIVCVGLSFVALIIAIFALCFVIDEKLQKRKRSGKHDQYTISADYIPKVLPRTNSEQKFEDRRRELIDILARNYGVVFCISKVANNKYQVRLYLITDNYSSDTMDVFFNRMRNMVLDLVIGNDINLFQSIMIGVGGEKKPLIEKEYSVYGGAAVNAINSKIL